MRIVQITWSSWQDQQQQQQRKVLPSGSEAEAAADRERERGAAAESAHESVRGRGGGTHQIKYQQKKSIIKNRLTNVAATAAEAATALAAAAAVAATSASEETCFFFLYPKQDLWVDVKAGLRWQSSDAAYDCDACLHSLYTQAKERESFLREPNTNTRARTQSRQPNDRHCQSWSHSHALSLLC